MEVVYRNIKSFKIFSLNTRGLANNEKRRAIFDKHRFHADLLILQETHSTPEIENIWQNEWGCGKIYYSHGSNSARGIAVCTAKQLQITNFYHDLNGRSIILDIIENNQIVSIAAIYAPNTDSPEFFSELTVELRKRQENKIIVGDFNLTLDLDLDRENTYCNNNKAKEEVEGIMDEFMLLDIWRVRNAEKKRILLDQEKLFSHQG